MNAREKQAAQRAVDFFSRDVVHTKGEWAGRPFTLEGWQDKDIVRPLFGTLNPDGTRQYRTALIGIPRKNGKSTLGAGMALKLLCSDGEMGAEIYSAAADREQAAIVFEMARQMIEANPRLSPESGRTSVYRRSIVYRPKSGGENVYRVLSADAFTKHGLNPHGIVFDELHAQPNRELWDVLTTGQGARRQPLTIAITTAGHDRNSICYELYEYGRKVIAGVIDDPTFFFRWWGADAEDDFTDPETWKKANPNYGISIQKSFLVSESAQAKIIPARQNTFKQLYCNIWTEQQTRWMDIDAWDDATLKGRKLVLVNESDLAGKRCFGGLDLSRPTDLASLAWNFGNVPHEGEHTTIWRFFLPEERLPDLDQRTGGTASQWVKQGHIELTPGDIIDYVAITSRITKDAETFDVQELAYAKWGMTQLATDLQEAGLTVFPFNQTTTSLSPGTKELERLVLDKKCRHGRNPVARWMISNTAVKHDHSGNVKPDKEKSGENITGVIAHVMALDRATKDLTPEGSASDAWFASVSWKCACGRMNHNDWAVCKDCKEPKPVMEGAV